MMNHSKDSKESNSDLIALYERGELTAEELSSSIGKENIPEGIKSFRDDDDDIYLSLNVQSRADGKVKFKVGIQIYFGSEFMGFRTQVTSSGKRTKQATSCKYRAANGVTLVSMSGRPEWSINGYFYSLMKADHLGFSETDVGNGVFIQDEKKEELMPAQMATESRKFYSKMEGAKIYDPNLHNQIIRGRVLKFMGHDKLNGDLTVSDSDFESIEFAVRAYNKHLNKNASPGEFSEHVMKMMNMSRMLTNK